MPSEPSRFDRDTAVTLLEPGRYAANVDRGWWIINGPNGGYVAAIVLRALMAEVADPARSPRSLTIHYLRPPAEGPVEVQTVTERAGRSLTTASLRMLQGGKLMALAIGAFADARQGYSFVDSSPPSLPPAESLPLLRDQYSNLVVLQQRYENRVGIGKLFSDGASRAKLGGYIRFAEPQLVDALGVAAFTDALPPATFTRASNRDMLGPLPTVDLTIHFRTTLPLAGAAPTDRSVFLFTSTMGAEGFIEEDGEIWSESGVLLAQSRQLSIVV
jgi:acyl-CoA thioesterase